MLISGNNSLQNKKVRVLHLNTLGYGGAFNAAYNIHLGLLKNGVDSHFLISRSNSFNLENTHKAKSITTKRFKVYNSYRLSKILNKLYVLDFLMLSKREFKLRRKYNLELESSPFNLINFDSKTEDFIKSFDVIHLHWIAHWVDLRYLFKIIQGKQIIWTMHDTNPVNGLLHFDEFPKINNTRDFILFYCTLIRNTIWRKLKLNLIRDKKINFIAPSEGLYKYAEKSLYKSFSTLNLIPYTIPSIWYSTIKSVAKRSDFDVLNFLIVADNLVAYRKTVGGDLFNLLILLNSIAEKKSQKVIWNLVGEINDVRFSNSDIGAKGKIIVHGHLKNRTELNNLFRGSDLFILTSVHDNLPNTLIESLTVGTPVLMTPIYCASVLQTELAGCVSENDKEDSFCKAFESVLQRLDTFDRLKISSYYQSYFSVDRIINEYISLYIDSNHNAINKTYHSEQITF
jgi:glycosyltransferase involved in cell wall biosynthesis